VPPPQDASLRMPPQGGPPKVPPPQDAALRMPPQGGPPKVPPPQDAPPCTSQQGGGAPRAPLPRVLAPRGGKAGAIPSSIWGARAAAEADASARASPASAQPPPTAPFAAPSAPPIPPFNGAPRVPTPEEMAKSVWLGQLQGPPQSGSPLPPVNWGMPPVAAQTGPAVIDARMQRPAPFPAPPAPPVPSFGSAPRVPTSEEMAKAAWLSNMQEPSQWTEWGGTPSLAPESDAMPTPPPAPAVVFTRAVVVPVAVQPTAANNDLAQMAQERWKTPQDAWPAWPPVEFGAQSPIPGRERDFEAYMKQSYEGQGANDGYSDAPVVFDVPQTPSAGRASTRPPPIDEERLRSSPGLQNNFYDLPTADFKRPFRPPRR